MEATLTRPSLPKIFFNAVDPDKTLPGSDEEKPQMENGLYVHSPKLNEAVISGLDKCRITYSKMFELLSTELESTALIAIPRSVSNFSADGKQVMVSGIPTDITGYSSYPSEGGPGMLRAKMLSQILSKFPNVTPHILSGKDRKRDLIWNERLWSDTSSSFGYESKAVMHNHSSNTLEEMIVLSQLCQQNEWKDTFIVSSSDQLLRQRYYHFCAQSILNSTPNQGLIDQFTNQIEDFSVNSCLSSISRQPSKVRLLATYMNKDEMDIDLKLSLVLVANPTAMKYIFQNWGLKNIHESTSKLLSNLYSNLGEDHPNNPLTWLSDVNKNSAMSTNIHYLDENTLLLENHPGLSGYVSRFSRSYYKAKLEIGDLIGTLDSILGLYYHPDKNYKSEIKNQLLATIESKNISNIENLLSKLHLN